MAKQQLEALLISQAENVRYLCGFTGSSGWLLVSENNAMLATDFRYIERAKLEAPGFEIVEAKRELKEWLPRLVAELGWHRLGFEAKSVSYDSYVKLDESFKKGEFKADLVPTRDMVEQLRCIKETEELDCISRAIELTLAAFEHAKKVIRPGISEREAAWEIEKFLREKGSEGVPFDIIVAAGSNSALPHARPTEKIIAEDEPVLLDMGARVEGYCSDFTRTLLPEKTDKTLMEIYATVFKAQAVAINGITAGMSASEADNLARTVIREAGYGDAFGHSLGHGVGLATHELPTLSPASSDVLVDNMVFTIEPGIYLPGYGGIRIEDMVILEKGKIKVLTQGAK
jgi:Xaa-Pro aminopeptidase